LEQRTKALPALVLLFFLRFFLRPRLVHAAALEKIHRCGIKRYKAGALENALEKRKI
jgi:hypothetical protein